MFCSIDKACFPTNLKLVDISPVYKKRDHPDKTNYRPVSILPAISKTFEKVFVHQIDHFMETKLSIHQCGSSKVYSAQHCLVVMLGKWRGTHDNRWCSGVLLSDLSKASDCFARDLLRTKRGFNRHGFNWHGFDYMSVKLLHATTTTTTTPTTTTTYKYIIQHISLNKRIYKYIIQHISLNKTIYKYIIQHVSLNKAIYKYIIQHISLNKTIYKYIIQHISLNKTIYKYIIHLYILKQKNIQIYNTLIYP